MRKFLPIFSLFALSHFGVVQSACDESVVTSCVNQIENEIEKLQSVFDKCRAADGLEKCLREDDKCGITDSAREVANLKNGLKCSEAHTGYDDEKCQTRKTECGRYITDTTVKDTTHVCNQLKEYERCMNQNNQCPIYVARQLMLEYMKVVGVETCPDISILICANMKMVESCEITYLSTLQMFDMFGEEEECGLTKGLSRCLNNRAKCTHDSSKHTLSKIVRNSACVEAEDNCDQKAIEMCELDMILDKGVPTCVGLKTYSDCLNKNATCDDHTRLILRNFMTDKKVDCSEVNACNKLKEEGCVRDLTGKQKIDCKELEIYVKCMKRADCNLQYLQTKFQDQKKNSIPDQKCDIDIDGLTPAEVGAECQQKLDDCNYAISVDDKDISAIVGKPSETCQNLKTYYQCMGTGICHQSIIRQRMAVYMKQLKVHDCPDLPEDMCEKTDKMEKCHLAFGMAIRELSAEGDEIICPFLSHLANCLRKDAKCRSGAVRRMIEKYLVRNQQCAEIDLCDVEEEEACTANVAATDMQCRDMEQYQKCLTTTANCQEGHVRATVRKIMSNNKVTCEDINDCNAAQELVCKLQLQEELDGDKCGAFKKYQECMNGAQCNAEFLRKDVERGKTELGNPCGSSALLPSLVLILVLLIFS